MHVLAGVGGGVARRRGRGEAAATHSRRELAVPLSLHTHRRQQPHDVQNWLRREQLVGHGLRVE